MLHLIYKAFPVKPYQIFNLTLSQIKNIEICRKINFGWNV